MTGPRTTGVWISASSATVLRWSPELTVRHRIDSTVPGRHRSTGAPPTEKHPAGEGHRDEHMRTFFIEVAQALPSRTTCCWWVTARSSSARVSIKASQVVLGPPATAGDRATS